jgi:hypothetical protein
MATSDVDVRPIAGGQRSKDKLIAEAVQILDPKGQTLSVDEIMARLNTVKELLRGVEAPRSKREELDGILMDIAIRQPNSNEETGMLIGNIFEGLAPKDDPTRPKRDAQGRIIPITDEDFPLRVLQSELQTNEGEAA